MDVDRAINTVVIAVKALVIVIIISVFENLLFYRYGNVEAVPALLKIAEVEKAVAFEEP